MNRKQFLVTLSAAGCWAQTPPPQSTPCENRTEFAERWVKRMMDVLDSQVDEPARARLMETMGELCYRQGHGERPASVAPDALDKFTQSVHKSAGPEYLRREGNTVYFRYPTSREPRCLCPLVEKGPEKLSGTYCQCSVGYVREMFTRLAGKPVKVQLVESLKRGGKFCAFRVEMT